jgi:hypothetical protein
MTVTHGTRSAYNRGCRCDACREASLLARAQQRAAAVERTSRTVPSVRTTSPWAFVVGLAAAGVGSLLHAKKLKTAEDGLAQPAVVWVVAGVVLLGLAVGLAAAEISFTPQG